MSSPTGDGTDDSTLNGVSGIGEEQRAAHGLWLRRGMVAILAVIIVAAGSGFLGVRSATDSARNDGFQVSVTYARIARAGLDVPFTIRIQAPEPITGDVVIAISADYFRMFETQGFFPEPSDVSSDADTVYLTFSPPPAGNVLVVDYDAYIQPAAQRGKSASIRVQVDGTWRVSTAIRTTLIP
jgi:hypothetical protein